MQSFFRRTNIFLEENSSVEFRGDINLSQNISFEGNCIFESDVFIDQGSIIKSSFVGKGTNIRPYSLLEKAKIGEKNLIGPFCFLRDNANIGNECIVGSYVEIARTTLCNSIKISHQAYLGDAFIEDNTIIGAGVVFCNYDGTNRQKSFVGQNVTIGSNSIIVSPVKIGKNCLIGAGSLINKDINDNSKIIQKR